MADLKGFYRQKKKSPAVSKPSAAAAKKRPTKSSAAAAAAGGATLGAGIPQSPALVALGGFDITDEYGEVEERLRQFDMDMRFGPCIGLSRLERWERAASMGLEPPVEIGGVLRAAPKGECLWAGRV